MKQLFTLLFTVIWLGMGSLMAQTDAGVTSLFPVTLDCSAFTSGFNLQVQYQNFGTTNIQPTISLAFSVDGQPANVENAPGINAGTSALYNFTAPVILTQSNAFTTIKIWAAAPGDVNAANDTLTIQLLSPVLAGLPFVEDFENFSIGVPGVLNDGWTRDPQFNPTWAVDDGSLFTTTNTGPEEDHTLNGTKFVYSEANGQVPGDSVILRTPCITLAGTNAPRMGFWYHMFGALMGELKVVVKDETTGVEDEIWSVSGQQQTSAFDPWLEQLLDLSPYAGDIIQIEFRSVRGPGTSSDIAIDDVLIFDPLATDMGVSAVLSPLDPSCYSGAEEITVEVTNFGSQPLDLALNPTTVTVDLTGPQPLQTFSTVLNTGVIPVLGTLNVSVTTTADLSVSGTYDYSAYTTLTGDSLTFNDTTNSQVISTQSFSLPFFEDFESFTPGVTTGAPGVYANGWTRTFSQPSGLSWFVDNGILFTTTATGPEFDHTANGTNWAYHESSSGLALPGDSADLRSPCLNVTGAAAQLSFWYHMFGNTMGTLEVYVDDYTTGSFDQIFSVSGQQQTSAFDPWLEGTANMTPYLGHVVQLVFRSFRGPGANSDISIDDVLLFEPPPYDVFAGEVVEPFPSCELGIAENVAVEIINFGSDTLDNIFAQFQVDANPFTAFEAVNVVLPPGDTTLYTFAATANLSGLGAHTITVVTTQFTPADTIPDNDTTSKDIFNFGTAINTFPYLEGFETGAGGWAASPIPPSALNSWQVGPPAKLVISGAASGVNAWVTGGLAFGTYLTNEQSAVVSPCFDLSSLVAPVVRLDIWWESEFSDDGAVLQYSTDGGNTWEAVGEFGDPNNWYNDNTINGSPGDQAEGWTGRNATSNGSNGWVSAQHDLDGLAGVAGVVFRIAFGADFFFNTDGFAFDNFEIFDKPPLDAEAQALIDPESGCGLDANTQVTVAIANSGANPFDSVEVSYQLNMGTIVTEVYGDSIFPGDTVLYTFNTLADFSTPGLYDVTYIVDLMGDTASTNDTLLVQVTAIQTVDSFPYIEDFESGVNGWQSGGPVGTWGFGTPTKPTIQGASSGANAWVTGGLANSYINQANSFVLGPCFDFTDLTAPELRLRIWREMEFSWDGAAIQSSTDNGATWQLVGSLASGINWYNDNTINGSPGGQAIGWTGRSNTNNGSGTWVTAQNPLSGLAGQPEVLLRVVFGSDFSVTDDGFAFDDFIVFDRATIDVGIASIVAQPITICAGDSADLTVSLANFGFGLQTNVPVQVDVTGPMNSTFTAVAPGSVLPNDTVDLSIGNFTAPMPGTYELVAYTVLAGDTTYFHDTSALTIVVNPVAVAPTTTGDTLCAATNAVLELTANSPNGDVFWLTAPTGGAVVGEGDTLLTPPINGTTTFYAIGASGSNGVVGPPSTGIGAGSYFNLFNTGVLFDVFQPLILETVRVYPQSAGTIQLNLIGPGGGTVQSSTFQYGGSGFDTTLTLNWFIQPGMQYQINALGTNLGGGNGMWRSTSGVSYPYDLPGSFTITGNTFNQSTVHYFFYNWNVKVLGCPSPAVATQAVLLPPISVDLGFDGTQCAGYTLNATNPNAISYEWNNDPNINTPMLTVDTTGIYTVEVFNSAGCFDRDTVVLFIKPTPEIMPANDTSGCDNVVINVDTVSGASYFWLGPNPSGQSQFQDTFLAEVSGTYFVTVTKDGCSARDTIGVTILPDPVVDLGPDQASCDSITLDAGPGSSFLWSNGETSQSITVFPPIAGNDTFSVVVTNSDGCTGGDEVLVLQADPPVVDLGKDDELCGSKTLDAGNPGDNYVWSTGDTTQTISVTQTGQYYVTVTDADNCQGTDTVDIVINPLPMADASFSIAGGNTVTFTNTSSPATGATYQWDFGDGTAGDTSQNPTHVYQFTGTFQVTLIVTNVCGSDTMTFLVENIVASVNNLFSGTLDVYPNPSEGIFFLRADQLDADQLQVEVTDARGRVVLQRSINHAGGSLEEEIDLSDEAEGIYTLRVVGSQQSGFKRIQLK